jgi:hypothetical protein
MVAVTGNHPSIEGLPSIVALVSEGHRQALSHFFAERAAIPAGMLVFAADTHELNSAVTQATMVLIEGSRLAEFAAARGVREGQLHASRATVGELGEGVRSCLDRLPPATAAALRTALHTPRAWSVKRVAHAAGVSTRQLVRHCAAAKCVVSPKSLLLAARLVAAQGLLRGPRTLNAASLARACGWVDARSLRVALRRAQLGSISALREVCDGRANVSDIVIRLARKPPNDTET